MIDFHSHVLPGIDDGSDSVETSIAMLTEMARQGVTTCVATPHYYAFRRSLDGFLERRQRAMEALTARWRGRPLLLSGAEVAFCSQLMDFSDDQLDALCIQGTRLFMLEMPFDQWSGFELDLVSQLCLDRGYRVILAHLDRFIALQRDKKTMWRLLELPLYVQINAESLLSIWQRKPVIDLFREGSAHILGSDAHNMNSRRPNLLTGRQVLEKKLGRGVLERIDHCGDHLLSAQSSEVHA